jgi:uncharacterized protein (TIGR00255 family)
MTGFGRGQAVWQGVSVEVELGSVNRKQFDIRISLPKGMATLEPHVNERVHRVISRGSVTGTVNILLSSRSRRAGVQVDADTAEAFVGALRRAAARLKLPDDLKASALLGLPEVVRFQALPESADRLWPVVEKALDRAIASLVAMRRREGRALERDLRRRFAALKKDVRVILRGAPDVPKRYRAVLLKRLQQSGVPMDSGDPQLLKELALFADRCDISEELVRLDSHFDQADRLLASREPAGRAMDFLCQEMFREINTIGSKANDMGISRCVIAFKAGLEAVREQVQNVE